MFSPFGDRWHALYEKYKGVMPAVDQAFVSVASLIITILVVRFVGLESFGIYSSLLVITYFGVMLSDSSVSAYIANVGKQEKARKDEDTFNLILVSIAIALSVALVSCLYINSLSVGEEQVLLVIFGFVIAYLLYEQLRKFYVLKDRFRELLILDVSTVALQLVALGFYLFEDNVTLTEILVLMLLARAITSFLSIAIFKIDISVNLAGFGSFFKRFYAEVKFLIPSGLIKYVSNQGFFIAMMALITLEQFGLVRLVQTLFKPSNFMMMAYENYLPKQLKGKPDARGYSISLNFVLVYIAIVFVSFAFAMFGDGVIRNVLSDEYLIDQFLIYCWGIIAFLGGLSLVLRAWLRVLFVSKKIFTATLLSGLASLVLLPAASIFGFGYKEIMLSMLATNVLYFLFLLYGFFKTKTAAVVGN